MASALGRKSRACDSCIKNRATWYCAADDAFLCQACDSSVHSANPLASRHERVRLKSTAASLKSLDLGSKENSVPSWHQGFTRKARTPRHSKSHSIVEEETIRNPFLLVPEVGSDEISREENEEEHPFYRVPVFDTLVTELCTSTADSYEAGSGTPAANGIQSKPSVLASCVAQDGECLQGFLSSDMDIVEFAADVESLLGRGLENESLVMEGLGLMDTFHSGKKVKLEEEEEEEEEEKERVDNDKMWNISNEPPSEWSFGSDSPATWEEEDDKRLVTGKKDLKSSGGHDSGHAANKRNKLLSLDYEAVIAAWTSGGSPWANGNRPDFDHAGCWHDYMGTCTGTQFRHPWDTLCLVGNPAMADGGREARVSRYREKRRTRLFSKKIRYEVRKLNAEKRPRMKGRFVKRTSFAGPAFPLLK